MTDTAVQKTLENIYASLANNNQNIDTHIAELKTILPAGQKTVTIDPTRLYQNNRQGRKLMQSYFKKRGVIVEFTS